MINWIRRKARQEVDEYYRIGRIVFKHSLYMRRRSGKSSWFWSMGFICIHWRGYHFQWNSHAWARKALQNMTWPHKAKYERYEDGKIKQVGVIYYWIDKSLMIDCVE